MVGLPEGQAAKVYADLNGGKTPQQRGYSDKKAPGERNAEALRAYFVNPAYIKETAPELAKALRKWVNNNPRLDGILHLNSVLPPIVGLGALKAVGSAPDGTAADDRSPDRRSPFGLKGPIMPDNPLQMLLNLANHQRAAERAVLPLARSADGSDGRLPPRGMSASVDLDHSGVREAIQHVRALKAELASLGGVDLRVRHSGFGRRGDHAPGAVRTALNGQFGHDGRALG